MANEEDTPRRLTEKLKLETAQIPWRELQTWFAQGVAIAVATDLDLLQVAEQLAADNAPLVDEWMQAGKVGQVNDTDAAIWYADDVLLWAVVIKPWVLVQMPAPTTQT